MQKAGSGNGFLKIKCTSYFFLDSNRKIQAHLSILMRIEKLDYAKVPMLAGRDLAYIQEVPALREFYQHPVGIESFKQVIELKKEDQIDRQLLYEVVRSQHKGLPSSPLLDDHIKKLKSDNTFTVVTAHQPSLFTGPLYYVYKIISVLNLAKRLKDHYPAYHFVPVFISGGEDHDFAEINHLHIFNKTLSWESHESGPVGLMKTSSLLPVLSSLQEILGDTENAQSIYEKIYRNYTSHDHYGNATFAFVHELFKDEGLLLLNASDARLKRRFAAVIREEILEQPSYNLVNQTIQQLEAAGFPSQATPREINFFYLGEQFRERIVEENGSFKVLNTNLVFSRSEMEAEIENYPERFSPNVIMRPLYQEKILPNLAYVGGGGELAYWLERKEQFKHFGLSFPMLIRRDSVLWIDNASTKRMEKLGLTTEDIFEDTEDLIKSYLRRNAESEFHLTPEKEALEAVFRMAAEKTNAVDPTLVKTVWAEHAKALKSLEQLEVRLTRAEKQKHDTAIQQIRNLKEKLFPGNGLQERYDNFLPLYLKHGEEFFKVLKRSLDPLEKKFTVVIA